MKAAAKAVVLTRSLSVCVTATSHSWPWRHYSVGGSAPAGAVCSCFGELRGLILDEAISLDIPSERAVQGGAANRSLAGRTALVIAHASGRF